MTLKQFGYVGAGIIFAVIFYYAPITVIIKVLFIPFFALAGLSLAFLPIEGRPMDIMAGYFIKAMTKPNQFLYQKNGGILSFLGLNLQPVSAQTAAHPASVNRLQPQTLIKEEQLQTFLYDTKNDAANPLDQKEGKLLQSLFTQTPPPAVYAQPAPPIPAQPAITSPAFIKIAPAQQSSTYEFPNLVRGIIRDSRGNVLGGILVEISNKDGESVRAFKTNALGQFASATQLDNGLYTVAFEDPKAQHKFDSVKIETNGSILPPLEVVSIDAREELRKSLFG